MQETQKNGPWFKTLPEKGILKKGMFVGSEGGIVKNIIRDKVIIQQNFVDVFGKKKKKIAVMKLHPEKRGE